MAEELSAIPRASSLIESMRAVGYSPETALADLTDNCISAGANKIRIEFRTDTPPYVAILDDGVGMDSGELTEAMRYGSRNPSEIRASHDLGRFGLGLKTASLSQCRKLTIISLKGGELSLRCWDLDLVAEREEWILRTESNPENILKMPHASELVQQKQGTLVIWQDLDQMLAGESNRTSALNARMADVRKHMQLVFHRFLSRENDCLPLDIRINNNPLDPVDPFLSSHKATQSLYEDTFALDGQEIRVKPFILPHISKLSREELELAGGEDGLRRNQGFYVYRNRRLIIHGTWFRLARSEELTKLARVRVDIPNSLDHLWTIDIKKSAAIPPEAVRHNLGRTVARISEGSKRVYNYKGNSNRRNGIIPGWERVEGREGAILYQINREHPALTALTSSMPDDQRNLFESIIDLLENTLPRDSLYADMASNAKSMSQEEPSIEWMREIALGILDSAGEDILKRQNLLSMLPRIEPFSSYPEKTSLIQEEFSHV